MDKKRFTLDLTEDELQYWRRFAASVGYTIGRGPYAKDGSIQKLFVAAACGDVRLLAERMVSVKSNGN